jgi:hypothetical protein
VNLVGLEALRRRLEDGWDAVKRSAAQELRGAKGEVERRVAGAKKVVTDTEEHVLTEAGAYADRARRVAHDAAASGDAFAQQAGPPIAHELKQLPQTMAQVAKEVGLAGSPRSALLDRVAPERHGALLAWARPPVPPPRSVRRPESAAGRAGEAAGRATAGFLHGIAEVAACEAIIGTAPHAFADGIFRAAHEAYQAAGGGLAGLKAIEARLDPVTRFGQALDALSHAIEKGDPYEAALAAVVVAAFADLIAKYGIKAPPPPSPEMLATVKPKAPLSAKELRELRPVPRPRTNRK